MARWATVILAVVVVAASAARVSAQTRPGPRPHPRTLAEDSGETSPRGNGGGVGPGGQRGDARGPRLGRDRMERMRAHLNKRVDSDLAWLREHDLKKFADRMAAIRDGDNPMKRILLWRVHRRIEGWRRLRSEDGTRAIENVRLEFATAALAKEARAAGENDRPRLEAKLRDAIKRQVDLRIEVQQAMAEGIKKRLDDFRDELQKQRQLRGDLVAQRFKQLADPNEPLPDPVLAALPELPDAVEPKPGDEGPDGPPLGPGDGPPGSERRRPGGRGSAERFDKQLDSDIQWLRDHELTAFADRIAQSRKGSASVKGVLLWRVSRWIRQLRRLDSEAMGRAVEGVRRQFEIADLARAYREAPEDSREPLAATLKESLTKQFEARHAIQRAIMESIQERLERIRDGVRRQRQFKRQLVNRRFDELMDPDQPVREPELVPDLPRGAPGRPTRAPD